MYLLMLVSIKLQILQILQFDLLTESNEYYIQICNTRLKVNHTFELELFLIINAYNSGNILKVNDWH